MLEFLNKLKQEHQDDDSLRALGEIETALDFNTQLKIKNKLMELSSIATRECELQLKEE